MAETKHQDTPQKVLISSVSSASSSSSSSNEDGVDVSASVSRAAQLVDIQTPPFTPKFPRKPDSAAAAAAAADGDDAASRRAKIPWTSQEDEILKRAVEQFKGRAWKQVAELLPGRTHSQAAHRWQKVLDPKLKKGSWTPEEDLQLQHAVEEMGEGHWSRVAEKVGSRNGKQCRERWRNQISPDVDKRPWLTEEDEGIVRLYQELGPKWAEIAKNFPGRTENAVKNRWNAKLGRPAGANSASPTSPAIPGSAGSTTSTRRKNADRMQSVKIPKVIDGVASIASAALAVQASSSSSSAFATVRTGAASGGGFSGSAFASPNHSSLPTTPSNPSTLTPKPFNLYNSNSKLPGAFLSSNASAFSNKLNSAAGSGSDALPPLPPKKKAKTTTGSGAEQMDATQALLALKAGASPGSVANGWVL